MASLVLPLPAQVARRTNSPAAREAAVDEAIQLLRGPRSLWPVDTGRSKRAWRRLGSGLQSQIFNPLRYASFVEGRNGRPAARTLARNVGQILRAARKRKNLQAAEGTLAGIQAAFVSRAMLEGNAGLYSQYLAIATAQRRRGRGIRRPAVLMALERRIREQATG